MTTEQNDYEGGRTPLTPPPASVPPQPMPSASQGAGSPAPTDPTDSGRTSGARAITIVTAIIGGVALLGSGGTAAAAAAGDLMSSSRPDSVQTVDVAGIESIDLDVDASSMRIEFGDVDEAELSITDARGSWTFERDEDELVVHSPDSNWLWWFDGGFMGEEVAVLTLPENLSDGELDADLTLDAGSLDVDGDFAELVINVSAGDLDVGGSARIVDVGMSAGRADILLDSVDDAYLGVSAGDLTVELTGTPPTETSISVSAGSVNLTVPDVEYSIEQDISAGSLDAKIDQSDGARRIIEVSLSAGSVSIRPGN